VEDAGQGRARDRERGRLRLQLSNIAELIAAWRDAARPVVFVRRDSREQGSLLSPDSRGNAFKEVLTGEPDLLVAKSVHSAFLGAPDLAAWLREQACDGIAVCGITTSHCCETTTWASSDIGFDILFVGRHARLRLWRPERR
jgi:nicotinamidase-related amidase